jgi:hypothetical protein
VSSPDPSAWRDFISKVVDLFYHSPRFAIILFLVSGILLFWDGLIVKLSLISYRDQFRPVIAIIFLVSACLLISYPLVSFYNKASSLAGSQLNKRHIIAYLHKMSPKEKEALKNYTDQNERTIGFHTDSGPTRELERFGILYRTTGFVNAYGFENFSIVPWIFDYLKEHKELLN